MCAYACVCLCVCVVLFGVKQMGCTARGIKCKRGVREIKTKTQIGTGTGTGTGAVTERNHAA